MTDIVNKIEESQRLTALAHTMIDDGEAKIRQGKVYLKKAKRLLTGITGEKINGKLQTKMDSPGLEKPFTS